MSTILNFCKPYLLKYKWLWLIHIVFYLVLTSTTIVTPYITGSFIDALIEAENGSFIGKYVAAFVVIGLLEIFLGYFVERLSCVLQMKVAYALNSDAVRRVQNVTSRYIQGKDASFLNNRINGDANEASVFCTVVPENTILNALTIIVPLVLVFEMESLLGVSMILLNVFYFLLYILLKKPMYKASYESSEEQSVFFSKLNEQLCSVKFIQTQGISKSFVLRLNQSFERLLKKCLKEQKVGHGFSSAGDMLETVSRIIIFIIGGTAAVAGEMSVGDFAIVMSYFIMSTGATQYFFTLGESIQRNKASCDRLKEIFDLTEQTNGDVVPGGIDRVECKNLTFGYSESKIIDGEDFIFTKGNIYALTGENGSGKSTLINLVLGLYVDEFKGTITYDGISIEKLDMREVRNRLVGVSEQEPMLLPETLRFNLTFEDGKEIDIGELEALCEMLDLGSLLKSLPNGLDTVINENSSNLSGGEKQKLSILRALLKKPQLLVLDEPTSALDKTSRENLCKYLKKISPETIMIISTHDKELIGICDVVLHIENGKKTALV